MSTKLNDLEDKEKFLNADNTITGPEIVRYAQFDVDDKLKNDEYHQIFTGLSKDEVLKYRNDRTWVRIRWILFACFWIIWIGMLVASILIIVFTPKCPPRPNLDWWQKDVFYQINVAKFKDSNDDGVGDLEGLTSKLDYLEKIGVSTLNFNPIMDDKSPKMMKETYGKLEDLAKLQKTLQDKNMHIVLDIPLAYLLEAKESPSDVLKFWLDKYVDGVRITKIDEIDRKLIERNEFNNTIKAWRGIVDEISKKTLKKRFIGFDFGTNEPKLSYLSSMKPNLIVNYNFMNMKDYSPSDLIDSILKYENSTEQTGLYPSYMIGTYDQRRVADLFINSTKHEFGQVLLLLLRGTPFSYYGDELGFHKEDYMLWDDSTGCGFTKEPKIAKEIEMKSANCKSSVKWQTAHGSGETLVDLFTNLINLRKNASFLWGSTKSAPKNQTSKSNVISFMRQAVRFDGYLVAAHINIGPSELLDFHKLYGIPLNADVAYYYSFINRPNSDLAKMSSLTTDSIILSYGDILVLKISENPTSLISTVLSKPSH